jgi:hypothetical protein
MTTRSSGFAVTAAVWNEIVDNNNFQKRLGYVEQNTNVSITATTEGTANTVVSLGAITYTADPTEFWFSCMRATAPASQSMNIGLFDGTTGLGIITFMGSTSPAQQTPICQCRMFTPPASSKTYSVRAWVSGGTGTIEAGAGGAATNMPIAIWARRVPT